MGLQGELPFADAEASHAERLNLLNLALSRLECDLHLANFVRWVFNATAGGREGELLKSYEELASRPNGLCCSYSKARSTVAWALQAGIVRAVEHRYASLGQRANSYTIDWEGVSAVLHAPRRPGASIEHPPALTRQGPASTRQPFKEEILSLNSLCNSGPDRRAGPEPAKRNHESEKPTEGDRGRRPAAISATEDPRWSADLREVPELAEAADRPVAPLPAGRLVYGVFGREVWTPKMLARRGLVVEWFRRQLSAPSPVAGATEADLLLVLATAIRVASLPDREIKKSRIGMVVCTLIRREWQPVLPHVPEARRVLDELLARAGPELLHGETWEPIGEIPATGEARESAAEDSRPMAMASQEDRAEHHRTCMACLDAVRRNPTSANL